MDFVLFFTKTRSKIQINSLGTTEPTCKPCADLQKINKQVYFETQRQKVFSTKNKFCPYNLLQITDLSCKGKLSQETIQASSHSLSVCSKLDYISNSGLFLSLPLFPLSQLSNFLFVYDLCQDIRCKADLLNTETLRVPVLSNLQSFTSQQILQPKDDSGTQQVFQL